MIKETMRSIAIEAMRKTPTQVTPVDSELLGLGD